VNTTYVVFPKSSGLYLVHVSLLLSAVFASHAPIIVYIATSPNALRTSGSTSRQRGATEEVRANGGGERVP
jgi:hypothetical protein